jgi:hypothetical protein
MAKTWDMNILWVPTTPFGSPVVPDVNIYVMWLSRFILGLSIIEC